MSGLPVTNSPARAGSAPLNPERPPPLLGKYAKLIGKDLKSIVITYDADGVSIGVSGAENTPYAKLDNANMADYRVIKQKVSAPSGDEKLRAFQNKFELRLNREFPSQGPASSADEDIQEFMRTLGFRERRALLMTQKQFAKEYPNGYTQA